MHDLYQGCSLAHLALLNNVVGIRPGEARAFQQVHDLSLPVAADQILVMSLSQRTHPDESSPSLALQQHSAVACVK